MGTRRSRHNKGRKPLYKDFRHNLVLEPAEAILDRGARYYNGLWLDRHRTWTDKDQAALFVLCGARADISKCADVLGRPPTNLAHRARDVGLTLPPEWRSLITKEKQPAKFRLASAPLQYPYVEKPRPE